MIRIDIPGRRIDLLLPEETIKERLSEWKLPLKKSRASSAFTPKQLSGPSGCYDR